MKEKETTEAACFACTETKWKVRGKKKQERAQTMALHECKGMRERFDLKKYRATRDKPEECDACGGILTHTHGVWEDGYRDKRGVSHSFAVYLCSQCNDRARMGQLPLNKAVEEAVQDECSRMLKEIGR